MAAADTGLPEQRHERQSMVSVKRNQHRFLLLPSPKIRKSVLEENQIIPLEPLKPVSSTGIRIESAGITITLPENTAPEQLAAVLTALKAC